MGLRQCHQMTHREVRGQTKMFFFQKKFGVPHLATCIFLFFYNEPELGVGIDPGMALTPLPSSIGQGLNPRPSDCEPSTLPLDHSFRSGKPKCYLSFFRSVSELEMENVFFCYMKIVTEITSYVTKCHLWGG
jgi:hypothetical protein